MDILGFSIIELRELLRRKEITSKELFSYFQKRIKTYDKNLSSYISETECVIEIDKNKKLQGIPLSIKDNFCIKGVRTTAASQVLDAFISPYSSTVTSRLEQEGAAFLGKTNMDAWAHGSSTETSDYGITKNPYDLTRVAGGSSGGSAASVASYLAPASIGTETAGSIRQPSAWCGTVGLKPTYGRVSRYGVIAMGSSWDCPGIITTNVEDAALLLGVIAGKDQYDATSSDEPVPDYALNIKKKKRLTFGVSEKYLVDVDKVIVSAYEDLLKKLEKEGHTIKRITLLNPKYSVSVYMTLQRSEVSSNLARYDGIRYGNKRSFFGNEAERRIMLGTYALSHGYYDQYYKKAQKVRSIIKDDFDNAFKDVDMIIAPTTPSTAFKVGESEKYAFFGEAIDILTEPAAAAGIPALTLPVAFDGYRLPIGIQIMAHHFKEEALLNAGYMIEKIAEFPYKNIMKEKYG